MNIYFCLYTITWTTLCVIAIFLYILNRKSLVLSKKRYWLFLAKPWKVITFLVAASAMTAVAPFSGDYTWDYYDASFMALLTFALAPWVVGVFYRSCRKSLKIETFIAFCAWMFSVSWSYDIYIYLRDKHYPPTWWPNIILSSILFACGGLLWNLDWNKDKGVHFSFKEDSWPTKSQGVVFPKIFIATLPYIFVVIFLCGIVIYGLNK